MSTLVSPGVLVREFSIDTIIPAVTASPGGFAGVFQWGPVDQLILVDSEDYLVNRYGKPSNFNGETWFSAASFLAYTDACWISRAANTVGNTQIQSFVGNSTNLAIQGGTSVLKLANTFGLAAGMKLFYANIAGLPLNSTISAVNSTTITLSAAASANIQAVEAVFRDDITFTGVAQQSDLNYLPRDLGDWDAQTVKNETDYYARLSAFDPSVLFVARCPGELGNSLRVSVCDTAAQHHSNTDLTPNNTFYDANATFLTATVGSNTLTVTIKPFDTSNTTMVTAANTFAGLVQSSLTVNDLVEVGNTTLGLQYMQVTSISSLISTANVFSFTMTCDDTYKLAVNASLDFLSRYWEFYNTVDTAPTQSLFVTNFGNTAAQDEMHVVVVDEGGKFSGSPGTVLEIYRNVSRATDAKTNDNSTNYFKNVINQKSEYLWAANDRTTAVSNTAQYVTSSSATKPLSMRMIGAASGKDEANVSLGTLARAWDMFKSSEDVDVGLLFQGKARGEAISNKTQLANYILDNVADIRNPKDCVLFISPDYDDVVNNKGNEIYDTKNFANSLRDTSYGFCDSGYKYMYDKYNDVNRWVPLNGDMAGLAARTDITNDPWWSIAGLNRGFIKNATRLAWNPRQAERDELYKTSVNPVISTPGLGPYLFGDKTLLKKPSSFDRINVRRLFIVLEKSIAKASRYSLFEFNDDFTRAQFRAMVNPFLRDIKGRRGITDFLVVCDATNNTPVVIDRNEFIGTILIKPARSINFITLNFVSVGTALSFSETTGFGG